MNKRLVYILLLLAIGLLLTATSKHMSKPVLAGCILALCFVYLVQSFVSIRRRAALSGPLSGLQKASTGIIYAAALGAVIALMLIVCHSREIGKPLLNGSLVLCIVGAALGIFAPQKLNAAFPDSKKARTFRTLLYLCIICSIFGELLKINHHAWGKYLLFGGVITTFIFLIFAIAAGQYAKTKAG